MFGSIIFCPRWDQAAQVKSQSISGTAFMWDDLNVSLLPCATAIMMAAQTPVLLFPQAQNQLLICTKPWALNPSQTLNNALRVGPHRGRVTLLSPDRGRTFSSPPSSSFICSQPLGFSFFYFLTFHSHSPPLAALNMTANPKGSKGKSRGPLQWLYLF